MSTQNSIQNQHGNSELLPCPFCGNKNISIVTDNVEYSLGMAYDEETNFKVICSITSCGCGASSGWCDTKAKAITAWNTRTQKEG